MRASVEPSSVAPLNAARGLGEYVRHRPEDTVLYDIVRDHLGEFLAAARERSERPLPGYVEQEFRKYLRCGMLAHGFLRARCAGCGADVLVAFSCKNRGVCPSCSARRMCATAAQIADDVLPAVPLRQWVVTVPFDLRHVLATRAEALTAVLRCAIDEIRRAYERRAIAGGAVGPRFGAVTFVHRFGGSLNVHAHFHVVAIDGVYIDGATGFVAAAPPTPEELRDVVARIARRVERWARRAGARVAAASDVGTGLEGAGAQSGLFATLDERGRVVGDEAGGGDARFDPRRSRSAAATHQGFSVHAGVTVPAWDRDGRERLCRYGARSPFSLARLSRLDDGRVAYRTKYPGPHGHTHRVMEPVDFIARIASLIPPPRYPLVRYHGVLAPNARVRARVVPARDAGRAKCRGSAQPEPERGTGMDASTPALPAVTSGPDAIIATARASAAGATAPRPAGERMALGARGAGATSEGDGASERRRMERIDWAELLRRVYGLDALRCPRCAGRLRWIAVITEPSVIRRVLEHLGEQSATGPPPARRVVAWAVE